MADDLAEAIVRASRRLHVSDRGEMVATVSLVRLPSNLIVPGLPPPPATAVIHNGQQQQQQQQQQQHHNPPERFWFVARGAEVNKPEKNFLYAEEAINFVVSNGFRRLSGRDEDEWRKELEALHGRTGREVGELVMIFAKSRDGG